MKSELWKIKYYRELLDQNPDGQTSEDANLMLAAALQELRSTRKVLKECQRQLDEAREEIDKQNEIIRLFRAIGYAKWEEVEKRRVKQHEPSRTP